MEDRSGVAIKLNREQECIILCEDIITEKDRRMKTYYLLVSMKAADRQCGVAL